MSVMSKKKPAREGQSPLNLNVDADLRDCLDRYIEQHNADEKNEHHATVRSTVEAALKMYLKSKGFWPPKLTS